MAFSDATIATPLQQLQHRYRAVRAAIKMMGEGEANFDNSVCLLHV